MGIVLEEKIGGKQMSKKKKITICIIAIISVIMILGIAGWFVWKKEKGEESISKVNALYEALKEKKEYSFRTKLDDNNEVYYAKKDNMAYVNTIYRGKEMKFLTKDGNSYLLVDERETYYTYQNNETNLEKITFQLEEIKDKNFTKGKEKIEKKEYQYEEYNEATGFLIGQVEDKQAQMEKKTRFYFKGNELVYIKTIIGDQQELLKVDFTDTVESNLFVIPDGYKEG